MTQFLTNHVTNRWLSGFQDKIRFNWNSSKFFNSCSLFEISQYDFHPKCAWTHVALMSERRRFNLKGSGLPINYGVICIHTRPPQIICLTTCSSTLHYHTLYFSIMRICATNCSWNVNVKLFLTVVIWNWPYLNIVEGQLFAFKCAMGKKFPYLMHRGFKALQHGCHKVNLSQLSISHKKKLWAVLKHVQKSSLKIFQRLINFLK